MAFCAIMMIRRGSTLLDHIARVNGAVAAPKHLDDQVMRGSWIHMRGDARGVAGNSKNPSQLACSLYTGKEL